MDKYKASTIIFILFSFLSLFQYFDIAEAQALKGNSIDVVVDTVFTDPSNTFNIKFLEAQSENIQVHVDYDLTIVKSDTNETIFKASTQTNQPILHTTEGTVSIPFEFKNEGQYKAVVDVFGINFIPILTESFTFPLTVSQNLEAKIQNGTEGN